eukprot:CAMPEP_0197476648 /NCGR_PEP_ID=MMETSP1309-20131121/9243_1 /TAXON_ID=464262 /ORGANISM="Genus nov. species nov., Strain RCC998" /LENGTH=1051 /DNA_ID=CAMNT_0043017065 /DNA_START=357 /DNA_END=3509 /DNA_ORIENTATION=-
MEVQAHNFPLLNFMPQPVFQHPPGPLSPMGSSVVNMSAHPMNLVDGQVVYHSSGVPVNAATSVVVSTCTTCTMNAAAAAAALPALPAYTLPAHTRYHVVEGSPLSLKPHYGARYMDRIDALQLSAAEVMSVPIQKRQLQQYELPFGQISGGPEFAASAASAPVHHTCPATSVLANLNLKQSGATFKASNMLAAAHQFYKSGDFTNALAYCNTAHVTQPQRTDVLLLLSAVHYQLKNYDQCVVHARQAIALKPDLAEAHSNLANALQKSGNLDLAAVHYRNAIHLKPSFTDSYNNLASLLVQKGQVAQAIQCYNLALNINPSLYVVCSNLGDLWRGQGPNGRQMAEYYYLQAIRYNQQYAPAWIGLAELWREQQQYARAVSCYKTILKFQPGNAETYSGLGLCYTEMKELNEAERCYSEVVSMYRQNAVALANLAGVYYEQGRLEQAIQTYKEAIKIDPNFPEVYNNLSNALREAGFFDDAISCYTTCIRIQCGLAPNASIYRPIPPLFSPVAVQRLCVVYNNLGGVLKIQGRVQEAIACFQQVRMLQPDSPEAHANLASAYKDCGKHDYAIVEYRQALILRKDLPDAFANYVHSMQCICDWTDRDELFVRLEKCVQYSFASATLPPVQPFHAMAYPFSESLALRISKAYASHCKIVASGFNVGKLRHPEQRPLLRDERLKIGYVSSDFGNHPLSHLMASVFGMHDKSKFEIFCYALSPDDRSEWRRRVSNEVEHFLDVSSWSTGDIVRRISEDGIHIAVNLNGYTKGAKNEIFALKPAPIQCSYMGFPATTGADFLQYLITDKVVAPKELHHCYSEKLALMPNCYFVNDYKQSHQDVIRGENMPSRRDVGLPEDKIIYSCSNQLYKYDPETFRTWCNILKRVPDSVLWLLRFPPEGEMNIRAEAAKLGIGEERIIFTNVVQKDLHIKRSGLADVFLDTPLCNAHTTGCDVLWSGCPMITLPLRRMASRVAASLVHSAGCPELIVQDHAEYEELAVRLGLDHKYRHKLREKLKKARMSCPLFNTKMWVKNFEKVFTKMWQLHGQRKKPETFE